MRSSFYRYYTCKYYFLTILNTVKDWLKNNHFHISQKGNDNILICVSLFSNIFQAMLLRIFIFLEKVLFIAVLPLMLQVTIFTFLERVLCIDFNLCILVFSNNFKQCYRTRWIIWTGYAIVIILDVTDLSQGEVIR